MLDVGCSTGFILASLDASNTTYGFDINEQAIRQGRELNPAANLLCHSMYEPFPYHDEMFDAVIMAHAMPHYSVGDPDNHKPEVLQEVYRVLKKGGTLYLTTSNKNHLGQPDFCRAYPAGLFYKQVAQDLQIFRQASIFGWNPLPSLLFFLSKPTFHQIPARYRKFLFFPSPVLARIPGCLSCFRRLMTKPALLKHSKGLYVVARK